MKFILDNVKNKDIGFISHNVIVLYHIMFFNEFQISQYQVT